MDGFIANTDFAWFSFLRDCAADEVIFWQPSGGRGFRAVAPGAPLFFMIQRLHHAIGGTDFLAHHSGLPAGLAWYREHRFVA